jgi:hypothetical protein
MPSGIRRNVDIPVDRVAFASLASIYIFNPSFAADLFFASPFARLAQVRSGRSTGSKQTLNGLFIFKTYLPISVQRYFVPFGSL